MTKKASTPALRFKGFTYTWKQRKLGELGTITTGNTPSTAVAEYYSDDGMVWVTPTDISENITYEAEKKLSKLGQQVGRVVPKNTILVTCIASIGKNTMLGNTGSFNQQINGLTPNENKYEPYFLLTESALWSAQMKKSAAAGTMQIVNRTEFSELKTWTTTLAEQKQIGSYFRNLDRLITLHQRKYDKLTNMKKSMLEKMFPKNGANVPEIRFKGFTDAWEQRKLGDIVQITMGQSPDGSTYSDVPSDYILVQGNADLQNGWVCPKVWTSQMTKKADAGDLIMSVRAPAGTMGKTTYNVVIGRGVAAIKGNDFIYQLLVKMDIDGFWKALSCGSTFESLNTGNIKNAEVLIPDIDEQEKIGQYFTNLDHLITLHQRELEKLKNLKKACLEKMFV